MAADISQPVFQACADAFYGRHVAVFHYAEQSFPEYPVAYRSDVEQPVEAFTTVVNKPVPEYNKIVADLGLRHFEITPAVVCRGGIQMTEIGIAADGYLMPGLVDFIEHHLVFG